MIISGQNMGIPGAVITTPSSLGQVYSEKSMINAMVRDKYLVCNFAHKNKQYSLEFMYIYCKTLQFD